MVNANMINSWYVHPHPHTHTHIHTPTPNIHTHTPHPTPHTHTPHPHPHRVRLLLGSLDSLFSVGSRQVSRKGASHQLVRRGSDIARHQCFHRVPCSLCGPSHGVASQLDFACASCQVVDSLQAVASCNGLQRLGNRRDRCRHAGWIREECSRCLCLRCVVGKSTVVDQVRDVFFDLG